jgi:L-lactate dehydrogenase (cytochrome)
MDARLARCANIEDLRDLARRSLPRAVFDFVDGAANDEVTARRNRDAFDKTVWRPAILTGDPKPDLSTTVLGQPIAAPIIGAPTGLTGLVHHEGELGIARAVHASGSVYILSSMASYAIEEIAARTSGPAWFQIYLWRDRELVRDLLARAGASGFRALVLTVDVPVTGARERDRRNRFGIPPRLTMRALAEGVKRPRWSSDFVRRPRMTLANVHGRGGGPSDAVSLAAYVNSQFDPSISWNDLMWLRETWDGPIVVKGVLTGADASHAVELGADAVSVSNHGGRQLDLTPSSLDALREVVDRVAGDAEVYLDGGVRRGGHVAAALALGARACLIGRPFVYGLGAAGTRGVARAVELLIEELRTTLILLGCPAVSSLDEKFLTAPKPTARV